MHLVSTDPAYPGIVTDIVEYRANEREGICEAHVFLHAPGRWYSDFVQVRLPIACLDPAPWPRRPAPAATAVAIAV
ncbi:hypothetical protein [Rhodococcus rhodnii]|uniref:hypothetical protein n=1 Tax=Rhodococcus rhodnii TaxID=38312 RepID=UPI0009321E43|nr:hypothetical protein [Rhodococcus rhodnii]